MNKQICTCTWCGMVTDLQTTKVSSFVKRAIGPISFSRQLKFLISHFVPMRKSIEALQCPHCGELYNEYPKPKQILWNLDYSCKKATAYNTVAEYDDGTFIVQMSGYQQGVNPAKDPNWFYDSESLIEAYAEWLLATDKPMTGINVILKQIGG